MIRKDKRKNNTPSSRMIGLIYEIDPTDTEKVITEYYKHILYICNMNYIFLVTINKKHFKQNLANIIDKIYEANTSRLSRASIRLVRHS